MKNWAGNYEYSTDRVLRPSTVEEAQAAVAGHDLVKTLGSRHSFNDVADTTGVLLSTERLDRIVSLDRERQQVTFEAGVRYGDLCRVLDAEGFALPNMASLPHISVAGACATATHGSGVRNGGLATSVAAVEIVRADGDLVRFARGDEEFPGAVVNLGALGPVVRLTLDLVPRFEMNQLVYEGLPFLALADGFDDIMGMAYSVSLFTAWRGDVVDQIWIKRTESGPLPSTLLGATAADGPRHPIGQMSPVNCTAQMGESGAWHERLPHFRMEFTPSAGDELQSEFLLPRADAFAALSAVKGLQDRIAPLLQISEIRTIAADDLWMSPFYERDCVAIHFTWKPDWVAVRDVLPDLEAALAPFDARPHWGKLFLTPPRPLPRQEDFLRLASRFDPSRKFGNHFLDRVLYQGA